MRSEYIYARTKGEVTQISISVSSDGEVSFKTPVERVYSERSYERSKGAKVLSRIPQRASGALFDTTPALLRNFDFVAAVDTNTRLIDERRISVTGVAIMRRQGVPLADGIQTGWRCGIPFCIEFTEAKGSPENLGWIAALEPLWVRNIIRPGIRIGLIVDSDLGNLHDYNRREKPIYFDIMLPTGVQLLYASSDVGKEDPINRCLVFADSASAQCLDKLQQKILPLNERKLESPYYEGMRVIDVDVVEQI